MVTLMAIVEPRLIAVTNKTEKQVTTANAGVQRSVAERYVYRGIPGLVH